ncbi:MAG: phosphatidylserine decarboxylase family protein [Phototrophicales bacterium]
MRIHKEGYPTLLLVGGILTLINFIISKWRPLTLPISLMIWGFFAQFFRNPIRHTPNLPGHVIAPADGKIVAIERVIETEYFQEERLKISIYMSAFNVHVNRVPITGKVTYVQYHPGQYLVAFHPKASELNERSTIVIKDISGNEILIRQIAGILARRIVTYLIPNQSVQIGEELGFIKFGSRCDIFLPITAKPLIQLNQHVTGGETPIAVLN